MENREVNAFARMRSTQVLKRKFYYWANNLLRAGEPRNFRFAYRVCQPAYLSAFDGSRNLEKSNVFIVQVNDGCYFAKPGYR